MDNDTLRTWEWSNTTPEDPVESLTCETPHTNKGTWKPSWGAHGLGIRCFISPVKLPPQLQVQALELVSGLKAHFLLGGSSAEPVPQTGVDSELEHRPPAAEEPQDPCGAWQGIKRSPVLPWAGSLKPPPPAESCRHAQHGPSPARTAQRNKYLSLHLPVHVQWHKWNAWD